MSEGVSMGNRANLVLVDQDGWQLRYSHWGGCRLLDALAAGPEMAKRYVLAQETVDWWTDELWADGGLVLDLNNRRLLFFGEELMCSMNERRAIFEVLAIVWQGFSISWAFDGRGEIAAYVGASPRARDEPWTPDLVLAEDTARLHHLVTVVDADRQFRAWPLRWGGSAAWCGPRLLDALPGAGQPALRLGMIPESGVHVDVPNKNMGIWLTTPQPGLLRSLSKLWPGWTIAMWGDRYEEHLGRCGPSVTVPDLDIVAGVDEVESWLRKRVYQSWADSPAGCIARLGRMFGMPDADLEPGSKSVLSVGEKPTAREWARFEAACAAVRRGAKSAA